ncbi:MAG: acyl-CoA dehydrogenase family protein [Deltaproteobacteria bacterium]|nr:acyl-CoA dehydrogenase family protein [Deltaproteobacteria bacterium]
MANFFGDNDDLQFYFDGGIDWEPIATCLRGSSGRDAAESIRVFREVATMVGEFVAVEVAPKAAAIDRFELHTVDGEVIVSPAMKEILRKIRALDLHGMCVPESLGGNGVPFLLYFITLELFSRGDASVAAHYGFHGGISRAALILSILEGSTTVDPESLEITGTRFEDLIREVVRGDAWGSMDVTEPGAGSDMSALRTVAEQDEDGNWFVSGQKIFLTSGHGKYHFVIARSERTATSDDPAAGLGGLSLFLVPAFEDRPSGVRKRFATVDRVEEKLGQHGSVTAAVTFDRAPAQLIGNRGDGFHYMLKLMNQARIGVGFQAIGLMECAYRTARDYAAQRSSMGKTIDRHEMIADYLDEMDTDIRALRAMAFHTAWHEEMAQGIEYRLRLAPDPDHVGRARMEQELKIHKNVGRRMTPLLKYLAAEKAVECARRCVQMHGGNGYMRDYAAERLLRDALLLPIYEGTSQIQALMAMKDTLSAIIKNPQEFVKRRAQMRWRALSARDVLERRVARVQGMSLAAQQHLVTKTATSRVRALPGKPVSDWPRAFLSDWDPKHDFPHAMLHAERLTRILADEGICVVLLQQARKDESRRELLERYLERAEPRCRFLLDEISTTGHRLVDSLSGREVGGELAG